MNLSPIKELIRQRAGLDLGGHAERTLRDSVTSRMAASGLSDEHAYYLRATGDEREFQSLVELVTINETYFFRDEAQLAFFAGTVAPRMLANGRDRLSILSAGCASGEEAYSLAILLAERFRTEAAERFTITGCDIDGGAIDRARDGVYRPFSFRSVDPARKARWFDQSAPGRWRIKPEIGRLVEFRRLNLFSDGLPELLGVPGGFDAIFLRNVSIYLDVETRKELQRRLAAALRHDGILLIGSAETLANDLGVLELRSEGDFFYFIHSTKAGAAATAPQDSTEAPQRSRVSPDRGEGPGHAAGMTGMAGTKREAGARLHRALDLVEAGDLGGVEALAGQAIRDDPWSSDAYYLLGLAARKDGRLDQAIRCFRQAVYVNPACWAAHYRLAELHRERGRRTSAAREYRVVLRALERGDREDGGLDEIPHGFSIDELRRECAERLAQAGA